MAPRRRPGARRTSIPGGFLVAISAIVLGHPGRNGEPPAKTLSTIALIVGYSAALVHGALLGWTLIVVLAFANSDWHF